MQSFHASLVHFGRPETHLSQSSRRNCGVCLACHRYKWPLMTLNCINFSSQHKPPVPILDEICSSDQEKEMHHTKCIQMPFKSCTSFEASAELPPCRPCSPGLTIRPCFASPQCNTDSHAFADISHDAGHIVHPDIRENSINITRRL